MIELMVALAVVGILAAVLIPAVQSARSTSHRIACSNRLKQIGIASHAVHSARGRFPAQGDEVYAEIYAAMGYPFDSSRGSSLGHVVDFLCPADPLTTQSEISHSYLQNAGTWTRHGDHVRNGYEPQLKQRVASDISDGLSQTAAFSERLVVRYGTSAADVTASPERYLWWTSPVPPGVGSNDSIAVQRCRESRTSQLPFRAWLADVRGHGYDHRLTPNRPGCWVGAFPDADDDDPISPPSSFHRGGVNVLFADGHVSMVADQIDSEVWKALGTINASEPLPDAT